MSYNFPSKLTMIMVLVMLAMATTMVRGQGTRVGFYSSTCPRVESIVQSTVKSHFQSDPTVAPGLLRMHFHDCFVQGCDGSILIDGSDTEKSAGPNGNLRGYEVIDDAKKQLEDVCPGVVSCADILALAARDSVALTNGASWVVPMGRKDGRVSSASDVMSNLPSPFESIDEQKQKFAEKGLNTQDFVTLIGGHTIGTTSCIVFRDRLYNFNDTGRPDPSIDASFLPQLQAQCPEDGDGSKRVALDDGSEKRFDNSFFKNLKDKRGIMLSDQLLWTDNTTNNLVRRFLGIRGLLGLTFSVEFGKSMVKMSNIGVKSDSDGEIRKHCSAFN
ncbi:peroxidase N1-like [Lycium barbarum]|uniref:peroxidase N1-like n=1 Tax=Lycium barbarum TaxID=112863 RepID=UPI00293F1FA0|nr:peroxidase N1-like [Lycium barbarum]